MARSASALTLRSIGIKNTTLVMIRMTTLGSFEVRHTNGADYPALLGHPKPAALLAYLATAKPDGFHRRDTLTAIFWSEQDSTRARASLRQALYFLRQQLGQDSLVTRGGIDVRLKQGCITCDVASFDEALERGDLTAATDLYAGPFLDGFHVPGAPEFERWVDTERDRLSRAYAEALERLASQAEDPADAVVLWRRLADHDPHRGRVALELMKALEAVGSRAAAIRVATKHASLLEVDLGATPDPDVEAFAHQLRDGSPPHGITALPSRQGEALPNGVPVDTPGEGTTAKPVGPVALPAGPQRWGWPVILVAAVAAGVVYVVLSALV